MTSVRPLEDVMKKGSLRGEKGVEESFHFSKKLDKLDMLV